MISIDIQVSGWKVKVKSQAYSWYVGKGGISVPKTSILIWIQDNKHSPGVPSSSLNRRC